MQLEAAMQILSTLTPEMRARRFATWRQLKVIPEDQIADIERSFDPPLPGLAQQAMNGVKAIVRNVVHVAAGKKFQVTPEVAKKRQAVCRECEFYRTEDDRCAHKSCACFLRFKTWLKAERCPISKW